MSTNAGREHGRTSGLEAVSPRRDGTPGIDAGLARLLTRLWSVGGAGEAAVTVGRPAPPRHRSLDAFVAVPSAARPRFLVPRADRRAMAAALTSYSALRRPGTRALRRGLAAAALTGAVGPLLGDVVEISVPIRLDDDAISRLAFTAHLRRALGEPGALVAMGVPPMDGHYKPTAQLFSTTGRPLAFAKVGWTPSTGDLVRREADTLRTWQRSGDRMARAPAVLLTGTWDGLPYVVTEPLPVHVRAVDDRNPLPQAAWAIAGDLSVTRLHDSPYWASVRERLDAIGPGAHGALPRALRRAVSVLDEVGGARRWAFGRWHGDWVSWNVARAPDAVYAWDWEHSTSCAPWGFDLLHWQITVPHLRHGVRYCDSVSAAARTALLPGVRIPPQMLLLAYLVEMGLRLLQLRDAPVDSVQGRGAAEARPRVPPDAKVPALTQELHEVAAVVMAGEAK